MEKSIEVAIDLIRTEDLTQFAPFPKIARLNRDCVITEKLDGTNAQVIVDHDGTVRAASRTRLISPGADNFGFAIWVLQNEEKLRRLGPGRHFGEWWGTGIQRKYNLAEKRFSLFNVHKWEEGLPEGLPENVGVVPVLYRGPFRTSAVAAALNDLKIGGSKAAPGFMSPEGVVIFHTASSTLYKVTLEGDEQPKSSTRGFNNPALVLSDKDLTEHQKQVKIIEDKRRLYDQGKLSPDAAREFIKSGCSVGTGFLTFFAPNITIHDAPE